MHNSFRILEKITLVEHAVGTTRPWSFWTILRCSFLWWVNTSGYPLRVCNSKTLHSRDLAPDILKGSGVWNPARLGMWRVQSTNLYIFFRIWHHIKLNKLNDAGTFKHILQISADTFLSPQWRFFYRGDRRPGFSAHPCDFGGQIMELLASFQ